MNNATSILLIIGVVVIVFVIRFAIRALVNKGADAVTNAIRRKQNQNNPARTENLADRYGTPAADTDAPKETPDPFSK